MAYRMYIGTVLLGALACRTKDGGSRFDTARALESASARVPAAAPIRDSSAGMVASTVTSGDTTNVRRDTATVPPPANAPKPSASYPSDTTSRTRTSGVAAAQRETTAVRPLPAAGKRPRRPAPTPLPAPDTTPSSRPATSPETARTDSAQQPAADKLAVNQSEYNGWKTFAVNCTRCHGEDAVGSTIAPNLMKSLRDHVDHDLFVQTVKNGRPDKGMPTWGPLLTDKQVDDLYAYLKARSEGRLAPGRPHVKPEG